MARQHASILLAGLLAACGAQAQEPTAGVLATRSLAATCAACHGTDGRAVPGAGMASLRELDKASLQAQLLAFRDGSRPATVMHQIAKGYTPEQIEQLAVYFSSLPRVAP